MSFGFGFGMAKASAFTGGPVPSLNLQFAGATTLDPRITFTRASTATYFDSSGVLTSASNNVARFDYNPTTLAPRGLLIEEQRTNLLLRSEEFDNASWAKGNSTVSANTTIAPDGNLTADKIVENTATGDHNIAQGFVGTVSGNAYTVSCYLKAAERSIGYVRIQQSVSPFAAVACFVNLSTGATNTVSFIPGGEFTNTSVSATAVGNGWYRVTVTATANFTANLNHVVGAATSTTSAGYTGDGTSGIFVWGAQLEQGSFATSYIPTVAAQVTRSADSASMTGTNFSSWYNATEGTLYTEAAAPTNALFVATVSDNTANNRILMQQGTNNRGLIITTGGVSQANISAAATYNQFAKAAAAYATNSAQLASNGALGVEDTSVTVPIVDRMYIGANQVGTSGFLNGHIRKLAFYPARLANATLQALTT